MKSATMIVDLQYGSCGKGLLAGYLAEYEIAVDTAVIAWGPNSGHTYIDADGVKYVNIALPNSIVSPDLRRVLIGPGSVIDPDRMRLEMEMYAVHLDDVKVCIHENAAVVLPRHREEEAGYGYKIGSTMKGVGAAVVDKIRRDIGRPLNVAGEALQNTPLEPYVVSASLYNEELDKAHDVMIEGSQGFSLSINHGFYPFTTSRDCTAMQILSDCGIPMSWMTDNRHDLRVVGTARTYPIRVANRYDPAGRQVGWSGPCYDDQEEITWSSLGIEPELTTVTRLPRRLFTFSEKQIRDACRINGVDSVFLNFCNYVPTTELDELIAKIERYATVQYTGWGPTARDIKVRG